MTIRCLQWSILTSPSSYLQHLWCCNYLQRLQHQRRCTHIEQDFLAIWKSCDPVRSQSDNATLRLMYRFHRTPYLNAILVFTAYTVITTSSLSGNCVIHTKSPVPLIDDAYTNQFPSSLQLLEIYPSDLSPSQDGYSSFLDDTYSSFLASEGLKGCTALIPPSQVLPTYLGNLAEVSVTAAPSTTASSTPRQQVHHTGTIILSVLLPTAGLMILLLCVVILRRYRKKRSHSALAVDPKTTSDTQLYLDQKAELEDDERRRHELEAGRIMHEMNGQDTVFEMPGDNNSRTQLASSHRTHELRGPDHTQELEVPGNV